MIKHPGNFFLGRKILLPFVAAAMAAFTGLVSANPIGGQVTAGQIRISDVAGLTTITQTDMRGIVNWQDFSIGAGEITQFIQPNASAVTLNRVVGGVPSSLNGTLSANGRVYLINPSGILVGPTGRINTAAFVASTLDVPDGEFLAGENMRFTGASLEGVVNLGIITAAEGDVILMGRSVENAGTINAPNGVAALAAGSDILMRAAGDERVVINAGNAGGGKGVTNSGAINAAQAELKAAGGNVYELAVNNTGMVRATGLRKTKGGRVILSASGGGGAVVNRGQVIAKNSDGGGGKIKLGGGQGGSSTNEGNLNASADDSGKPGGTVEMLGDRVTVGNGSTIDVSGSDGGLVAIGISEELAAQATPAGGLAALAQSPGAKAAVQTTFESDSRILANSTISGNGGNIIVWSDLRTIVGGVFEAKAGATSGNGGLIETSGKLGLTIAPGTRVNSAAPNGVAGTWLLDPAGIQVTNTPGGLSGPTHTQNANVNNVTASDVLGALTAGTNVTIQTTAAFPLSNRDIVVDAALPLLSTNPDVTLSLLSAGGIVINQQIGGVDAPLGFNMTATSGSIDVSNTGSILAKTIYAAASGSITLAGNVKAQGGTMFLQSNQDIIFTGGTVQAQGGTMYLQSNRDIIFAGGTVQSPVLDLRAGAKIYSNAAGTVVTGGSLALRTGPQGVGSASVPLGTSVTRLEALVGYVPASPVAGGVFIENTGVTELNIGGVDAGLSGVQVPIDAAYKDIFISTSGSLLIGDAGGDRVTGPSDVGLFSSADLKVFNNNANSVRSHFGAVTLSSVSTMEIGEFFSGRTGSIRGATGVNLLPGGALVIRAGSAVRASGTGDVFVMGGDQVSLFGGRIETFGGNVTIFTGPNTLFSTGGGSSAGIDTTVGGATHGNIILNADHFDIQSPINAGSRTVTIKPVLGNRSVDLGSETLGKISLTDFELSQITANQVNIFSGDLGGDILVSSPLNHPASNGLGLFTPVGRADINAAFNRGAASIGIFTDSGLGGTGRLTAGEVVLFSGSGGIDYNGEIIASNLRFQATGNVVLQNAGNNIGTLGSSTGGTGFGGIILVDGVGDLTISDPVTTTGAFLSLKTPGNLIINAGGSLTSSFLVQLDISSGNLINQNPSAAAISNRYVVYERDPFGPHAKGGLIAPDFATVVKIGDLNNDPNGGVNSVFYYTNLTPPRNTPTPPKSPTGGPFPPSTLEVGNVVKPPVPVSQAAIDKWGPEVAELLAKKGFDAESLLTQSISTGGPFSPQTRDLINEGIREASANNNYLVDRYLREVLNSRAQNTDGLTINQINALQGAGIPFTRPEFNLYEYAGKMIAEHPGKLPADPARVSGYLLEYTRDVPINILKSPEAQNILFKLAEQSLLLETAEKQKNELINAKSNMVRIRANAERDMQIVAKDLGLPPIKGDFRKVVDTFFNRNAELVDAAKKLGPSAVKALAANTSVIKSNLNTADANAAIVEKLPSEAKIETAITIHENQIDYWKEKLAGLRMPSEKAAPVKPDPAVTQAPAVNQPTTTRTESNTVIWKNGAPYLQNADGSLTFIGAK